MELRDPNTPIVHVKFSEPVRLVLSYLPTTVTCMKHLLKFTIKDFIRLFAKYVKGEKLQQITGHQTATLWTNFLVQMNRKLSKYPGYVPLVHEPIGKYLYPEKMRKKMVIANTKDTPAKEQIGRCLADLARGITEARDALKRIATNAKQMAQIKALADNEKSKLDKLIRQYGIEIGA